MGRAEASAGWPMAYEQWDDGEVTFLRANRNAYMEEITWRLGRSENAVRNKLKKLRISRVRRDRRTATRDLCERIKRARMRGSENWQVAQQFGLSSKRASTLFWLAKQRQGGNAKSR